MRRWESPRPAQPRSLRGPLRLLGQQRAGAVPAGGRMSHLRQLDIVDSAAALSRPIHIVGCGSVGSWTAITLAKLGASELISGTPTWSRPTTSRISSTDPPTWGGAR